MVFSYYYFLKTVKHEKPWDTNGRPNTPKYSKPLLELTTCKSGARLSYLRILGRQWLPEVCKSWSKNTLCNFTRTDHLLIQAMRPPRICRALFSRDARNGPSRLHCGRVLGGQAYAMASTSTFQSMPWWAFHSDPILVGFKRWCRTITMKTM